MLARRKPKTTKFTMKSRVRCGNEECKRAVLEPRVEERDSTLLFGHTRQPFRYKSYYLVCPKCGYTLQVKSDFLAATRRARNEFFAARFHVAPETLTLIGSEIRRVGKKFKPDERETVLKNLFYWLSTQ